MTVTASRLRQDVYRLLDQVLETGQPLEIERKGRILKVMPEARPGGKLASLTAHRCTRGDPEAIVHCDWSAEWSES